MNIIMYLLLYKYSAEIAGINIIPVTGIILHRYYITLHTAESFLNLVDPIQIWIVVTLHRFILHATEFRLVLNLSETV